MSWKQLDSISSSCAKASSALVSILSRRERNDLWADQRRGLPPEPDARSVESLLSIDFAAVISPRDAPSQKMNGLNRDFDGCEVAVIQWHDGIPLDLGRNTESWLVAMQNDLLSTRSWRSILRKSWQGTFSAKNTWFDQWSLWTKPMYMLCREYGKLKISGILAYIMYLLWGLIVI